MSEKNFDRYQKAKGIRITDKEWNCGRDSKRVKEIRLTNRDKMAKNE